MVLNFCKEFIGDTDVTFDVGWFCWRIYVKPPHISLDFLLYCAGLYFPGIFPSICLWQCCTINLGRPSVSIPSDVQAVLICTSDGATYVWY